MPDEAIKQKMREAMRPTLEKAVKAAEQRQAEKERKAAERKAMTEGERLKARVAKLKDQLAEAEAELTQWIAANDQ